MYVGKTQASAVVGLTISRAPERVWQQHFSSTEPQPELVRGRLARRVLESEGRWIAIDGAPGMGRTTLLGQVADELLGQQEWFHTIWNTSQRIEALAFSRYERSRDLRPIARWLRAQAARSQSGYATLLIDDYDTSLSAACMRLLDELLLAVPNLRVITTSIDPLSPSASLAQRGVTQFTRVAATELLFSEEETTQLCAAVAAQQQAAASLVDPKLVKRLFDTTRGIPLGVGLAIDRLSRSDEWPEYQLCQVMNLLYTGILRAHLSSMNAQGLSAMYNTFSLMPRFSYLHISECFPEVSAETIRALAASPALDGRRRILPGEYTWSEDFLLAAKELSSGRVAERRELATKLYRRNYAGGAFEQWFLAGDLARAEAMLRTRFLTVYETLSPETAREVFGIAPTELAAYPMIRVMQMLLDPRATPAELRQCIENLAILGARGGASGLIALSVRAAVLARKGLAKLAYEQAEQVLHQAAELMLDDSEETEAERRSVAEATLTAALALFEVGAIPSRQEVLPRCYGSPFLRYRSDLAQYFLDAVRADHPERHLIINKNEVHSYRSLVFSGLECARGIEVLNDYDEWFVGMLQRQQSVYAIAELAQHANEPYGSTAHLVESYEMPEGRRLAFKCYTATEDCLRLLSLGDQVGAVSVAYREDLLEPQASILRATVLLATGRLKESREMLEALGPGRGARTEAARAVLRACVLVGQERPEAARAVLARAMPLPSATLVQAFGFVSTEAARMLAELYPPVARFVNAAEITGMLGTGNHIGGTRRYEALTEKERVVLLGLREGLNTREIADRQFLSVNTVRTHVRSIGKKLNASGQAEMLRRAEELRIFADA